MGAYCVEGEIAENFFACDDGGQGESSDGCLWE